MALFLLSLRLSLEGEDKGEGVTVNMTYFIANILMLFHPTRCFVPMVKKKIRSLLHDSLSSSFVLTDASRHGALL
jgi:hypothetical protein